MSVPELRMYQRGDEWGILTLRRAVAEVEVTDKNSVEFWRHENLEGPAGPCVIALARDGRRVVSQFVLLPGRVHLHGRCVPSYQSLEVMTDERYRKQGLFTRLGEMAQEQAVEQGAELLWAFPNDRSMGGFVSRFGWRIVATVPLLTHPLPAALPGRDDVAAETFETFDPAFRGVVESIRHSAPIAMDRSIERLEWRYRDVGPRTYRRWAVRTAGRVDAFVVWRVATQGVIRIGVLMECGSTAGVGLLRSLIAATARTLAREDGVRVLFALFTEASRPYRAVRGLGFVPLVEKVFPYRFRLAVKPVSSRSRSLEREVSDIHGWYASFGDDDVF